MVSSYRIAWLQNQTVEWNILFNNHHKDSSIFNSSQEKVQAYFGWAKPCSCSYCCSRHLWFYDSGSVRGRKKKMGDSPHFLFSSKSFNMALSRAKTFARPQKTPVLHAACIGVFCSLHYTWGKLKTTKQVVLIVIKFLLSTFELKKIKTKQTKQMTGYRNQSSASAILLFSGFRNIEELIRL